MHSYFLFSTTELWLSVILGGTRNVSIPKIHTCAAKLDIQNWPKDLDTNYYNHTVSCKAVSIELVSPGTAPSLMLLAKHPAPRVVLTALEQGLLAGLSLKLLLLQSSSQQLRPNSWLPCWSLLDLLVVRTSELVVAFSVITHAVCMVLIAAMASPVPDQNAGLVSLRFLLEAGSKHGEILCAL